MPKTLVSSHASARPAFALQATRTQALDGHFLADHLGWWRPTSHPRSWCRLVEGLAAPRLLTSPDLHAAGALGQARPYELRLPSEAARLLPSPLARRLAARTPLLRLGTTTVWEAAATAVVRQVVHRDQARSAFGGARVVFTRVQDAIAENQSAADAVAAEAGVPAETLLKLSQQGTAILVKVAEVDAFLRGPLPIGAPDRQEWLFEVHPEMCFRALNGGVVPPPKTTALGQLQRLDVVRREFPDAADASAPGPAQRGTPCSTCSTHTRRAGRRCAGR